MRKVINFELSHQPCVEGEMGAVGAAPCFLCAQKSKSRLIFIFSV